MTTRPERAAREAANPNADRLAALAALVPEAFADGELNVDRLASALGLQEPPNRERFTFAWTGKHAAVSLLETPLDLTLAPDAAEASVDWDETHNIFIEGDNLKVLHLLYRSYFSRVRLVYIDPPYNTGKDFIYPDNYRENQRTYLRESNQVDEQGNATTDKREVGGRLHSAWLSMMYPRLFLARQLLQDDGVIMLSIDDHEVHHLRLLMNEIFGEENFIAQLVWEKGRKNDAKLFSSGHEYILVYARSLAQLTESKTVWRESKPGAKEIVEKYRQLKKQHGEDYAAMEAALRTWYDELPDQNPAKKLRRYRNIDKWGPWRDRDITKPDADGARYEIQHPELKQPVRIPDRGWIFPKKETMQQQIDLGLVIFRDTLDPPIRKAHLIPVPEELDEDDVPVDDIDENEPENEAVGMQVMGSYFYAQSQSAVKALRKLMGAKLFDNPKDPVVLSRLFRYVTPPTEDVIVLDFFGGSGTTAEAIMAANREDGGRRRFIVVQLDQPTPEKSEAKKAGYDTISELAQERIRRVIKAAPAEVGNNEDRGMRAFKLTDSNFKPVAPDAAGDGYAQILLDSLDPLKEDAVQENVVWELALKEGLSLSAKVERVSIKENTVFRVVDDESKRSFTVCLDLQLDPELVTLLDLAEDDLLVCRDRALTDELLANWSLACRLKVI